MYVVVRSGFLFELLYAYSCLLGVLFVWSQSVFDQVFLIY